MSETISLVIPAYNEVDTIATSYKEIRRVLDNMNINYEFIFVDDGSCDGTYDEIKKIHDMGHNEVHCVSFTRNFGKDAAIIAGLREAKGDCCVVMDCDLQHPPVVIPEMYKLRQEGYDIVEGVKKNRGHENIVHKLMAKLFYWIISKCSNIDLKNASDFVLMDRRVVEIILSMPEKSIFFRGLSRWVGFKAVEIPFEVADRFVGKSKWSSRSLTSYAIRNITTFSAEPLQIVTVMGALFIFGSLFVGGEALYRYFTHTALGGFTTIIGLILLTGGIIMVSLGIIGIYISRIYDEVKNRPKYLIDKSF